MIRTLTRQCITVVYEDTDTVHCLCSICIVFNSHLTFVMNIFPNASKTIIQSVYPFTIISTINYPGTNDVRQPWKFHVQILVATIVNLALIGLFSVLVVYLIHHIHAPHHLSDRREPLPVQKLVILRIDEHLMRPSIGPRHGVRDRPPLVGLLDSLVGYVLLPLLIPFLGSVDAPLDDEVGM